MQVVGVGIIIVEVKRRRKWFYLTYDALSEISSCAERKERNRLGR